MFSEQKNSQFKIFSNIFETKFLRQAHSISGTGLRRGVIWDSLFDHISSFVKAFSWFDCLPKGNKHILSLTFVNYFITHTNLHKFIINHFQFTVFWCEKKSYLYNFLQYYTSFAGIPVYFNKGSICFWS